MGDALILHRNQAGIPKFTYTGNYALEDDQGNPITDNTTQNWRLKLLSDGVLTFQHLGTARRGVDVFLVGAGGKGQTGVWNSGTYSWAGGGSGYTTTQLGIGVQIDTGYSIKIGKGATAANTAGEATTCTMNGTTYSALGGKGGHAVVVDWSQYDSAVWYQAWGGNGGSGGGASVSSNTATGGVNGTNGSGSATGPSGTQSGAQRGLGQGRLTTEFEEANGFAYAQGGGKNTSLVNNSGNGGNWSVNGSSGIVIIRNTRS